MQFLQPVWDFIKAALSTLLSPSKLFSLPGRMVQMSLPATVAVMVALFLIVCVAALGATALKMDPRILNFLPWWQNVPVVAVLVIVIPLVTYYAVKLWMEEDETGFEDIERAWRAGVAELERNGLDLRQIPLFLVIGSEGPATERSLFTASGIELSVNHFPPGDAALHWYASQDAIYLVCTEVGCLSHLAQLARKAEVVQPVAEPKPGGSVAAPAPDLRMTFWPSEPEPPTKEAMASLQGKQPATSLMEPPGMGGDAIRGTLFVSADSLRKSNLATPEMRKNFAKQLVMDRNEEQRQTARMAYLCRLIRRARRPLCSINGVLATIPLNLVLADDLEGVRVKQAVRTDNGAMLQMLKVRCPITALVIGWEAEQGFEELVKRLGRDVARDTRFGKGCDVWTFPSPEELGALSQHACGAFQDWVYHLFRDKSKLGEHGNRQLYGLLCRVHRYLEPRLDKILVEGFAEDLDENSTAEPLLFAGCYFAAARASKKQAFVKSVFERLPQLQEELAWTQAAVREDERYHRIAMFGLAMVILFAGALGTMAYLKFFR